MKHPDRNIGKAFCLSLLHITRGVRLWTFQNEFAAASIEIGIAAAPVGQQTPLPDWWWLSPRGWQSVAVEYVKIFYYRLRY